MTFNQYQTAALKTAIYPEQMHVEYPCMGLCGESGEVADKIKKLVRDQDWYPGQPIPDEQRKAIALELGDVMWYVAVLADRKGWTLSDALNAFDMSGDIRINDRAPHLAVLTPWRTMEELAVLLCATASGYAAGTMMPEIEGKRIKPAYIVAIVIRMATWIDYSLEEICQMNIEKLQGRMKRGTLHGSGDER